MNFDNWLILFINPQIELLTGGMSQLDSVADIFRRHLEQRGIDRDGGIVFNFSVIGLVKIEIKFVLLEASNRGVFCIIEIVI